MAAKGGGDGEEIDAAAPAPAPVAAAPAKKSPMLMIAAAVVIIGGGASALLMKGGGSATQVATKADAAAPAPSAPVNTPSTTPADPKPGPGTQQAGTKAPAVQQMGKSATAMPNNPPAAVAPAGETPPRDIVDRWLSVVSDPNASAQDGTKALAEINPIVPKLSGQDKSNAVYAQMFAYGLEGSDVQLCRAAKDVIANDAKENHKLTAKAAMEARQCK